MDEFSMLAQQQKLVLSPYLDLYEKLIPKNNQLRRMKEALFENTEYFKEKAKERYKIEAKNSELKNQHGYNKSMSYGIENMELQGVLTIFAVNLKRILRLLDEKENYLKTM